MRSHLVSGAFPVAVIMVEMARGAFLTSIERWSLKAAWRFLGGNEPCPAARLAARVGLGGIAPHRKLELGFPP
jgi:hypothetical protein